MHQVVNHTVSIKPLGIASSLCELFYPNDRASVFIQCIGHEQFQYAPPTIPAPQNYRPNQNGFQQELYYEDGKDLHYSSQHGSHSTDFNYNSNNNGPNQSQSR